MDHFIVRYLRIIGRSASLAAVLSYFAFIFAFNAKHRRSLVARAHWLNRTAAGCARVLGARTFQTGTPPKGTLIVANHVSYIDIIIICASMPVVFVAKSEVAGWPVFGWFARLAGTRFINRQRRGDVVRVADDIAPALQAGLSVVLFLEGTSSDGSRVLPFKASLLEPAVQGHLPVTPAAIAYKAPAGHSAATEICWWGDMTLAPHLLHVFSLSHIDAHLAWGTALMAGDDRKALAVELQSQVSTLHSSIK